MDYKLSTGAIQTIAHGGKVDKPVFQVLGIRNSQGPDQPRTRYRLLISDGRHTCSWAMLGSSLNPLVNTTGELGENCIVKVEKMVVKAVTPVRKVIVILELNVIASGIAVGGKIGNPSSSYDEINRKTLGGGQRGSENSNAHVKHGPVSPKIPPVVSSTSRGNSASNLPTSSAIKPSASATLGGNCIPICNIYRFGKDSIIRALVTDKSSVKPWSCPRGEEGKVFSIDLTDYSGEIRMTGYNQAVDQFYEMIKVNGMYLISKFNIQPASSLSPRKHSYELSFGIDTQVIPYFNIPKKESNFVDIAAIPKCDKDKLIDFIGICKQKASLSTIYLVEGEKELKLRQITVVDRSNAEVVLTLYGKQAEDLVDYLDPVLAVKGVKVSDFNGKHLSVLDPVTLLINPDISEAHILRKWYDNEGQGLEATSLLGSKACAPWKLLREARADAKQAADVDLYYFTSKVMVMTIKQEDAIYKACVEKGCDGEVVSQRDDSWKRVRKENENETYRCRKCDKSQHYYKWRVLLNVSFADFSDSIWATCSQDHGERLLGETATVLGTLFETSHGEFDKKLKEAIFQNWIAKFRAEVETCSMQKRINYTVIGLQPVDYAEYAKELATQIKETIT